jgi:hypothetical protein
MSAEHSVESPTAPSAGGSIVIDRRSRRSAYRGCCSAPTSSRASSAPRHDATSSVAAVRKVVHPRITASQLLSHRSSGTFRRKRPCRRQNRSVRRHGHTHRYREQTEPSRPKYTWSHRDAGADRSAESWRSGPPLQRTHPRSGKRSRVSSDHPCRSGSACRSSRRSPRAWHRASCNRSRWARYTRSSCRSSTFRCPRRMPTCSGVSNWSQPSNRRRRSRATREPHRRPCRKERRAQGQTRPWAALGHLPSLPAGRSQTPRTQG